MGLSALVYDCQLKSRHLQVILDNVEPEFWRWSFSRVFAYKFWWGGANEGTNFDLPTGRLAVREMQKDFDLSTGQLSQRIPAGICHKWCRFGRMGCALTGEFEFGVFVMGKRLRIIYFSHIDFSYYWYIFATIQNAAIALIHRIKDIWSDLRLLICEIRGYQNTALFYSGLVTCPTLIKSTCPHRWKPCQVPPPRVPADAALRACPDMARVLFR